MECEVCGRPLGRPIIANIEGVQMKVCPECAKLGSKVKGWHGERRDGTMPASFGKKVSKPMPEETLECIEGYNEIIRKSREKMNLTMEEFGKRINEKESIIARLESGKMVPDLKLAKKLEQALGVKFLVESKIEVGETSKVTSKELTIGDVISIKKKPK